jgi:hypothetical protein
MNKFKFAIVCFLSAQLWCQAATPAPYVISLQSLLNEMVNRDRLSEFPSPAYTCRQFSSYDRARTKPGDKSWFSNWDRSMFVRTETNEGRTEYVMMDTDGPGAVVRFWMTFGGDNTGKGILRIYFDNNKTPVIEGNPFDILSRGALVGAPLSTSVSDLTDFEMRGHNLYLPLPYSTHCKITYQSNEIKDFGAKTGGEAVYYNIDYRTYPSNTKVVTFTKTQLKEYEMLIRHTQKRLTESGIESLAKLSRKPIKGTITPGRSLVISVRNTQSAIRQIQLKFNAQKIEQALRSTILHITFDNKTTVECPVGDFFATGYHLHTANTWYTRITADGTLSCFWVMPFKQKCTVRIENRGDQPVELVKGEIATGSYAWTENTMYFGSTWKQFSFLQTGEMKSNEGDGGPFDLNYVEIDGKGVYVGDEITLFNTVYAWWGEGDEKVYVDNETFPSAIGTGTEDYYGYAWCRPEPFTHHPFIVQPDGSGNFNPGYTNNIRFRGLDGIPFTNHLKFDMEMWHWTRATIHFAPTTYWYILPGQSAGLPVSRLKDASLPVALVREDIVSPAITGNKVEGENMKLESMTGHGYFRYSNNVDRGWSGNMQLVWGDVKPSEKLTLSFVSDVEKKADITLKYSEGADYGSYKVTFNNGNAIVVESCKAVFSVAGKEINSVHLKKGFNIMTVEFLPSPGKCTRVGIDCLEFSPD